MRDMICKLMEDAGLEFGENISDGNGGTVRYGGWRERGAGSRPETAPGRCGKASWA